MEKVSPQIRNITSNKARILSLGNMKSKSKCDTYCVLFTVYVKRALHLCIIYLSASGHTTVSKNGL